MDALKTLKECFGYSSFRNGQKKTVQAILSGKDVIAIMPTGAGKSICYQLPAIMSEGITLVISPLISLMQDQVKALKENGIRAAYINSSLTESQISKALFLAKKGTYKIIYVSPERLENFEFISFAQSINISMITVDEAHCVSQWGYDFRPSYLKIRSFTSVLKKRPIISAFTATATEDVKNDIINLLGLKNPTVVATGFDRKNLHYSVVKPPQKDLFLIDFINRHADQRGIIYCATRKNVDFVYDILIKNGIRASKYHAGISPEIRRKNQENFIYDRSDVMVATNAFGMGIDKPDVRYVIHYNMPQCIENYYQEAGRAGRDGEDAQCVLMFSPNDIRINEILLSRKDFSQMTPSQAMNIRKCDTQRLNAMKEYCTTTEPLRNYILNYFGNIREENTNENIQPAEETSVEITAKYSNLFKLLKNLRHDIAHEKNVPAYIIFSDRTLKDMCLKLPSDKTEMLSVNGVGERKFEQYGEKFLNEISNYIDTFKSDKITDIKKTSAKKEEFYLTPAEAENFLYKKFYYITNIKNELNRLRSKNVKKLSHLTLYDILLKENYIEKREFNGKSVKRATVKGLEYGIREKEKTNSKGERYMSVSYPINIQKMLVEYFTKK